MGLQFLNGLTQDQIKKLITSKEIFFIANVTMIYNFDSPQNRRSVCWMQLQRVRWKKKTKENQTLKSSNDRCSCICSFKRDSRKCSSEKKIKIERRRIRGVSMSMIAASKMGRNTISSALSPPSDRDQVNGLPAILIIVA